MATVIGRLLTRTSSKLLSSNGTSIKQGKARNASYKAAVLEKVNSPLKIEKYSTKKTKKGQVRINVRTCGVNASDILICKGEWEKEVKVPFVPGFEICGEVAEIGPNVSEIAAGDRVIALSKDNFSGFAEQCIVSQEDVFKIPSSLDFEVGAALAESYATALLGLSRRASLKEGQVVLVTGAAGGLGLAVVDVAANVYKAKVIGVCSNEEKATFVRDKGAWAALTYDLKDLLKTVKEVSKGKGVSVIFDTVGGEVFQKSIKCAAHESKVVVGGFASGQVPKILTSSLLTETYSLMGVCLSQYRIADPEIYREVVLDAIDMCEQGLLKPHVSHVYQLNKVNDAISFITERKSTGKVVIKMD